jgi:hypothetical protein
MLVERLLCTNGVNAAKTEGVKGSTHSVSTVRNWEDILNGVRVVWVRRGIACMVDSEHSIRRCSTHFGYRPVSVRYLNKSHNYPLNLYILIMNNQRHLEPNSAGVKTES